MLFGPEETGVMADEAITKLMDALDAERARVAAMQEVVDAAGALQEARRNVERVDTSGDGAWHDRMTAAMSVLSDADHALEAAYDAYRALTQKE